MAKLYVPASAQLNGERLVPKEIVDPKTGKRVVLFVPEGKRDVDNTHLQGEKKT